MNRISLNEFQAADTLSRFRLAIDYLRTHPGTTLTIPAGDYILADPEAVELQHAVMYGEFGSMPQDALFTPGMKYVTGLDFTGCRDVTIEGQGANLYFDGFLEPILIGQTVNFTLKGITLDYLRRPFSKGYVESCMKDEMVVDFGEASYINAQMPMLRAVVVSGNGSWFKTISCLPQNIKLEDLGNGRLRLRNFTWAGAAEHTMFVTHSFHFRPGIHLYEAVNTLLEEVTILSHHGMGVVAFRSTDIILRRCAVIPAPGEGFSTNTDATHFASCRGSLTIEQCVFRAHGDDAANVHNYYHTITAINGNSCELEMRAPTGTHSQKEDLFEIGDSLELIDPKNLAFLACFKARRHTSTGTNRSVLELDRPLPESALHKLLADVDLLPKFVFRDNLVCEHFARSVLVKCRNVQICDNTFINACGMAIQIAGEAPWAEGSTSENVLISRNRIWDCGLTVPREGEMIPQTGGIVVNIAAEDPHAIAHKNITIENNIIDCPQTKHAIYAGNTEGMTVQNNRMRSQGEPRLVCDCK